MTEILYYKNPDMYSFSATVASCETTPTAALITLDKSAFYPEGGGQPADRGRINGLEVLNVKKKEGVIYHYLSPDSARALEPGTAAECLIDAEHRLDYMQQHSGQHIISAAMSKKWGIATVSVHQGADYTAIETSEGEISGETLNAIEDEANRIIRSRIPILEHWTDSENLSDFKLRRPSKHRNNIRIIEIPGVDCVACGGIHLPDTGAAGLVKYTGQEKIRGNVRTFWKIGQRAYDDYRIKTEIIDGLTEFFSSPQEELLSKARAAAEAHIDLNYRYGKLQDRLAEMSAVSLCEAAPPGNDGKKVIIKVFNNEDPDFISSLLKAVTRLSTGATAFIFNETEDKTTWGISESGEPEFDFQDFREKMLPLIGGKGGGKPPIWQGIAKKPEGRQLLVEELAKPAI